MKKRVIIGLIGFIVLGIMLSACGSKQDELQLLKNRVADENLKDIKTELVRAIIQDLNRQDNIIATKDWTQHNTTSEHLEKINKSDLKDNMDMGMRAEAGIYLGMFDYKLLLNQRDLLKHDITQAEYDKKIPDLIKEYEDSKKTLIANLNKYLDGKYPDYKSK